MINIVLYHPEIAGNIGNIIRTCAIGGAKLHIIKGNTFSANEKSLKRAALEYQPWLDIKYYDEYQQFLDEHPNIEIFCLTRKGIKIYSDVSYVTIKKPIYLLFGSETYGLPQEILTNNNHFQIRIPMKPFARSLNLANAVAIVLYEIQRQFNYENLAFFNVID